MTTDAAAELYLAEHRHQWAGKGAAFFNPHGTNMNNLPVIYGFNNGGTPGMYHGMILAEDGTFLRRDRLFKRRLHAGRFGHS